MYKTHMPPTQLFYFVCQNKRGISAIELAEMPGMTYKTAWSTLKHIRIAMGQRDKTYQLSGVIEFNDAYFGSPANRQKRGRDSEMETLCGVVLG